MVPLETNKNDVSRFIHLAQGINLMIYAHIFEHIGQMMRQKILP